MITLLMNIPLIILFLIIATVFKKFPPKDMSGCIGYRTKRSRSSREAWDYGNKRYSEILIYFSLLAIVAILVITVLSLNVKLVIQLQIGIIELILLSFIMGISPNFIIEGELAEKFNL